MMFDLAHSYRDEGMTAYSRLQESEFEIEKDHGYRAIKHQSFVGAGYFDAVNQLIMSGESSTLALVGSTEAKQFKEKTPDYTEAEIHHVGGAELKRVPESPKLIKKPDA